MLQGISLPTFDDGTYRVDPFVAVVIHEQLRNDPGPFEEVEANGPSPAGYRVGSIPADGVFARLGLQEGDIVEALNGRTLDRDGAIALALEAAEHRLTATIFREDLSFTNSYRFDAGLGWRNVLAADEPEPSGLMDGEAVEPTEAADPPERAAPAPERAAPRSGPRAASRAAKPSRPKPAQRPKNADIQCASSTSCTITKRRFDDLRTSPSRLQAGVDIVPAIRNDVFSGYKLKRVSAKSPVHALGFRAGDKVTHINGRDLTDDAQAMALYWSLGGTKLFKVRYERSGRRATKTIRVQ